MAGKLPNTYRTLLVEKFTKGSINLKSLLQQGELNKWDDSTIYKTVLKNLEVHSFKEFLEKFTPRIYEVPQRDGSISYQPETALTGDEPGIRPIDIPQHSFFKMLRRLYEGKAVSGQANVDFDPTEFKELLKSTQEVKEIESTRNLLGLQQKSYAEAIEAGKDPTPYKKSIIELRKKAATRYQSTVVSLLPMSIELCEKKIQQLESGKQRLEENPNATNLANSIPQLTFNENGDVVVKDIPIEQKAKQENAMKLLPISKMLENDYKRIAGPSQNEKTKELVVAAFSPDVVQQDTFGEEYENLSTVEEKKAWISTRIDNEQRKLNGFKMIYSAAEQGFVDCMTETVAKLLGVRTLFDLATKDGGEDGYLQDGILVANCKLNELQDVEGAFKKYLKAPSEQAKEKIWFAAIPAVDEEAKDKKQVDEDAAWEEGFEDEETTQTKQDASPMIEHDTLNDLKWAIDVLTSANIITVFSFLGSDKTGFSAVDGKTIQAKHDQLNDFVFREGSRDHAVYAFPNFTLLGGNETVQLFDPFEVMMKQGDFEIDSETGKAMPQTMKFTGRITLHGVYIEAAYPAVGLLIRSQQQDCLSKAGFAVDDSLPCVRVDLSDPDIQTHMTTKFTRENLLRWNQDVHDAIDKNPFAFVFCGNQLVDHGEAVTNTYVYQAETLDHKPIANILFGEYLRCTCKDWNMDEARIKEGLDSLTTEWHLASKKKSVNKMLLETENVQLVPAENGVGKEIEVVIGKKPTKIRNLKVRTTEKE